MNEVNKEIIHYIKEDKGYIFDGENNCFTQFKGFVIRTAKRGAKEVVSSFCIERNGESQSVLVTVVDIEFDDEGKLVMVTPAGLPADLFEIEEGGSDEEVVAAFNNEHKKHVVSEYFAI